MYADITQSVDVLPFKDSASLPIANIFAPLLLEEDLKANNRIPNPDSPGGKQLESMRELFFVGEHAARRIFMKGEAGCGKTLFSLKLLDSWCKVKQSDEVENDVLEQCLSVFDLVFYIPLRHYEGQNKSVKDMIGQNQNQNLLSNSQVSCLVILDGLDESRGRFQELPSMGGIVNYVLFCTSRPWKLTQLKLKFRPDDKVVKILGLSPSSEMQVIEHVLFNFYKLPIETQVFKTKFQRYSSMVKKFKLCIPGGNTNDVDCMLLYMVRGRRPL